MILILGLILSIIASCTGMAKNKIISDVKNSFFNFDVDKDSLLNKTEYTKFANHLAKLYNTKTDNAKIEEGFIKNDLNKDNQVSIDEFISVIKNFK